MHARLLTENVARMQAVPVLLQSAETAAARTREPQPRILVPVDGSRASEAAVDYVIAQARTAPLLVHLLNVQPAIKSGDVSVLISTRTVEERRRAAGERALSRARRMLLASRVEHVAEVAFGSPAETIVRCAEINGCSKIVLSAGQSGFLERLLRRRVVQRVVKLARIPVTVVKASPPKRETGRHWAPSPAG
jgi:nucleotide-binding universal stress UspA family protein